MTVPRPVCICRKGVGHDPRCPVHGNENQLELQDDDLDEERPPDHPLYDPETSPWPPGY